MAGVADAIVVQNPIIAKGAGTVALTTSATSSLAGIRLSGAAVTTSAGAQTYGGPVVLAANTSLASGSGGDITFSGRLDGPQTLAVSAGGRVGFAAAVGGVTPLRGVTISRASGVAVADAFALNGAGGQTKANGLTIAAGVNNVVFSSGYTGGGRTFSGFGGSGIRLAGSSASSRFSGITSTKNGTGLRVDAGTYTDTTITGSSFSGNTTAGISLANARGVAVGTTLAGNSLSGNGSWGLRATGNLTGTQVQNNTIEGNAKYGVFLQAAAGLQLGGTALNSGNRIVNATAWRAYATGVYATGASTGTRIQGNTIRSNSGNGVMLVNATRITVGGAATGAGNLIASNGGFGITAGGTCTGSLIQGNVITGNALGTVNVRNAKGIRVV
jgi:hypothetical protein